MSIQSLSVQKYTPVFMQSEYQHAFNSNGNKGIACGLGNIQIRDGEPLGGRTNAADDFATDVDDDFLS